MPSPIQYQITISNFSGNTPCEGYYIYTGLTHNIDDADYINGTEILIPITTGYTFNVTVLDSIPQIFLFVEHCDGHINPVPNSTPKLQGGYQLALVDLRCTDCYFPCSFGVNVFKIM
jgi:hypothetical protein